jgi:uncharacterized peroxidase-related enzyme
VETPWLMEPDTLMASNRAADVLLRGLNTLSPAERELIAIHVSAANGCVYCAAIHSTIAAHYLGGDDQIVAQVKEDFRKAAIPEKLKALLSIAGKVRGDGQNVTGDDIHRARRKGATDLEIHDTLLIASMFCMCNGKGWRTHAISGRRPRSRSKPKIKRATRRGEK